MADNIQRLVPFPANEKSNLKIGSDGSINGVKAKVVNLDPGAIALKEGVVVDVPKNIMDRIGELLSALANNWQLAVIGLVAIFVLIKD